MTKDKTRTVLTGTDNFDIWKSRMKLRLKSKGLAELLAHGSRGRNDLTKQIRLRFFQGSPGYRWLRVQIPITAAAHSKGQPRIQITKHTDIPTACPPKPQIQITWAQIPLQAPPRCNPILAQIFAKPKLIFTAWPLP